jgi:hypothetical protein
VRADAKVDVRADAKVEGRADTKDGVRDDATGGVRDDAKDDMDAYHNRPTRTASHAPRPPKNALNLCANARFP